MRYKELIAFLHENVNVEMSALREYANFPKPFKLMKAIAIKTRAGGEECLSVQDIDSIYIQRGVSGCWYTMESLYEYLMLNPGTIQVDSCPFPDLLPASNGQGAKYVRSQSFDAPHDVILQLPRG